MMKAKLTRALLMGIALALASAGVWAAVIGRAKTPLDGRPARTAECTLGDLVADAAQRAVKAEVALIQAGQLREEVIPEGELSEEQLRAVLVYPEEQVVLVEISGAKLQAALERSLSALPQPSIGFLQVAGMQVQFRSQGNPDGRIESIAVAGKPLDPQASYRAAVPASLAKGALGYFRIFNGLQVKETGPQLQQAVCEHVRASGTISLAAGDRLHDLSPPPAPR